ncbi:MAG: hypothetical protein M1816_006249 [Peltula sp. TS41687]|nr:MAG: hypothetical protein M1816_006249 [Peltula sp. TS41687]
MATFDSSNQENHGRHHKRGTSSVLKNLIGTRNHKRNPSAGDALAGSSPIRDENRDSRPYSNPTAKGSLPFLPASHPHTNQQQQQQRPLGELVQNQLGDPTKVVSVQKNMAYRYDDYQDTTAGFQGLHGENIVPRLEGRDRGRKVLAASRDDRSTAAKKENNRPPKKSKSSTSLSALLKRPKSSKALRQEAVEREMVMKEGGRSAVTPSGTAPPPIYARFTSQPAREALHSRPVPLNDTQTDREMLQYTPLDYSPSKQRNLHGYEQPTLGRPATLHKPRPKSEYLMSSTTAEGLKNLLSGGVRSSSNESSGPPSSSRDSTEHEKRRPISVWGGQSVAKQGNTRNVPSDDVFTEKSGGQHRQQLTVAKRGTRVMEAVATFNQIAKEAQQGMIPDRKAIDSSFETLLDSRNIPQNMRQKLRSLDTRIKADFIKQDNVASLSTPSMAAALGETHQADRPVSGYHQTSPTKSVPGTPNVGTDDASNTTSPSKRARPRSRTFTLNRAEKGGSPTKKQKSDGGGSNTPGRAKSSDYSRWGPSKSLTSLNAADAVALGFGNRPAPPVPQDFVTYLKEVQDPKAVEVGRLHKLRLVLRNERVAWVDSFISMGGMTEVVLLLHRIMAIEWREEHEDTLLHEVLLCLKALCTTALALRELHHIQATLFPALIRMLFDEEKKGPSEFTTRGSIISLMVMYLSNSSRDELPQQARTILSYIRDPAPTENEQLPSFISTMHQSRPYKQWCREIIGVTKEVFWIFLHNGNVVPILSTSGSGSASADPGSSHGTTATTSSNPSSYTARHFPSAAAPVPAAPYVGGVEWDATQYIRTHLDLLNGVLASLPSADERNGLRQELRMSGFEKTMGISLRTCKEKIYSWLHDGLKTWVAAAVEDGWPVHDVRFGPSLESRTPSPVKRKIERDPPPRLELPRLDLGAGQGEGGSGWVL